MWTDEDAAFASLVLWPCSRCTQSQTSERVDEGERFFGEGGTYRPLSCEKKTLRGEAFKNQVAVYLKLPIAGVDGRLFAESARGIE